MRAHFDEQLLLLNKEMVHMSGLCEDSIRMAAEALSSADPQQTESMEQLVSEIHETDRLIESIALRLLLQQQPVARDLRVISSALKMVTDLHRIGVQSADICEIVSMGTIGRIHQTLPFRAMADCVIHMVNSAMDGFIHHDEARTREAIEADDLVDTYFDQIRLHLLEQLTQTSMAPDAAEEAAATGARTVPQDPHAVTAGEAKSETTPQQQKLIYQGGAVLDLLMIAKYLERMGDHVVNIATWVIYSITGTRPTKAELLKSDL